MAKALGVKIVFACVAVCGCEFPRPTPLGGDRDGAIDVCAASQPLRCDGDALVSCNIEGTAEVQQPCALGCNATELRCTDVNPSNGLAEYLSMTASERNLDLGASATINTDDGTIVVDGSPLVALSATLTQASAPMIRVFIVRGLQAGDVRVSGTRALAIVSDGDISLGGVLSVSAFGYAAGPGAFNETQCRGAGGSIVNDVGISGSGGGGFGSIGGRGGSISNNVGAAMGGLGGNTTGNPSLTPLRGGCDSGNPDKGASGYAGGAMQLVSRTKIVLSGVAAANGTSFYGGGSGGGILLESPVVEVSGSVVANGGAGSGGCLIPIVGEYGRLDAMPAMGGIGCANGGGVDGGNGAAGHTGATGGSTINLAVNYPLYAGNGGGGVGRIRVNTAPGSFRSTGLFSPNPSTGTIATR